MKYTSLFCAAIAAMGMQAFAVPTEVASDNFNGYDLAGLDAVEVKTINDFAANGWSVVGEDQSAVVSTHFDNGGQALKLNTNGETLTLTAQTPVDYTATVTMKVEMVASDTMVDMTGDTTTQTALFLYKPDENAEAGALMAFSYDTTLQDNVWVELTDANFTALDDKDLAAITIVINYATEEATYTVNGTTFAAVPLANPDAAAGHQLNSVAFRGTGFVDDLFVGAEQTGTFATFIYELAGVQQSSQRLDFSAANFGFGATLTPDTGYQGIAELDSRVEGSDTKLVDLELANNRWSIDANTYNFVEGATYVIKADYELKDATVTIYANSVDPANLLDTITQKWFTTAMYTPPQGATYNYWTLDDQEQYDDLALDGIYLDADSFVVVLVGYTGGTQPSGPQTVDQIVTSGTLTWTAIDMAAGTVSFSFTPVAGFDSTAEIGNMALSVKPSLTYAQTFAVPCTNITFAAGTGTAMIDTAVLDQADQAFLVGLEDYVAPNQGE